jgi:hypothetical protein
MDNPSYNIPEDVKQDYLKHGGTVLDKWVLKNVRCPTCGGRIKTSACDIGGKFDSTKVGALSYVLSPATSEYWNTCVVRCGNCGKQFTFRYSYYAKPNSPSSFVLEGAFGWTPERIMYIVLLIIVLIFLALVVLGLLK